MPQDRSTLARLFRAPALLALALLPAPLAVAQQTRWSYPPAERTDVADTLHGTVVADPYRWLEDPDAPRSREWIEAQNKLTFGYLEAIPQRAAIKDRLTALWNFERFGTPFKEGGHYFWSRNDGLQNQNVIYVADSLAAQPRVLIDPNTFSADGTVALSGLSVSEDGRHVAYGTADGGSDWNTWRVRDIATGADLPDTIEWVKFSGASWTKDGKGFFYSRYDKPAEGQALRGTNHYPKVHYHVVGTPQAQDPLIYDRADQKEWGLGAFVTEDGRYIILNVSKGTDPKNRVFYRDLRAHPLDAAPSAADQAIMQVEAAIKQSQSLLDLPDATPESRRVIEQTVEKLRAERAALVAKNGNASRGFVELLNDFDASYDFVGNDGPVFWFKTDLDAPRGKLIAIDTRTPQRDRWTVVIPQGTDVLQGVSAVGGHLVASYLNDAKTQVKVFNPAGTFVREVELPGIGSAGGFGGKWDDPETFFSFTSFTTPTSIYRYDVATGTTDLFKKPEVDFDGSRYETRQVFYTSKDGTRVPMFITHRKDIALDGTNPTFLYGYGGFNIPITPGFSVANAVWLEMGGVYAVANIRGGSEYGEEWHQAGTRQRKQNVFDDFIAAAEWLIANKYTSNKKLAIAGGSNGGLLVGACMTQRPDLFGACLPAVGVLDMLRFHKFTIGWAWTSDYGSADNADEFPALLAYSPYHNVRPGTCYPPTLITTGDHDDRVVPAHSFKFAAALQHAQSCDNPVLIRIETRAGHGAGKPTAMIIEEQADIRAFLVRALGMKLDCGSEGGGN